MLIFIFIIAYVLIVFEHNIRLNKSATALAAGVLCWVVYVFGQTDAAAVNEILSKHLADISGIIFFLLGAMTIVELVDAHDGFEVITSRITTTQKRSLLWIVGLTTFFLSAILDNLTATIVMISLLRKLMAKDDDRIYFVSLIVIAANAGGAWSPIGDITTTMLWIGGQLTPLVLIKNVFIPSLINLFVPLLMLNFKIKGQTQKAIEEVHESRIPSTLFQRNVIFIVGIGALLFVPVFKAVTQLPPYMGMLLGLAVVWIVSEILHSEKDELAREPLSVVSALRKIDTSSILFFLGILLSISALEASGYLHNMANLLSIYCPNQLLQVSSIGLASAVIDNVPLVAASIGMYPLTSIASDQSFWLLLAYCAGTGGSILIIGSAAGIAAMGMESISFFKYLKAVSGLAILGYILGIIWFALFSF